MTKSASARRYAYLNSGIEHEIYEKYPRLMLLIFMSAMYSFGMPVINILNIVSLIIGYIFEKIIVAWYFRKPPLYDDTLNRNTVYYMKWASLIYCGFAYWMVTNRQVFENQPVVRDFQMQMLEFDH